MLTHFFRSITAMVMMIFVVLTLYVLNIYVDIAVKTILPSGEHGRVVVERGVKVRKFARQLEEQELVSSAKHFTVAYLSQYPSSSLQAGLYEISDSDTILDLVEKIARGSSVLEKITIVEGWQWRQIREAIRHERRFKLTSDHEILQHANNKYGSFLRPRGRLISVEGMMMPDTYKFKRGISDVSIIDEAMKQQMEYLKKEWANRDMTTNYRSPYQALIVASLIERESRYPGEYSKIAAVILNRIRINMPLQIDASVIYGMGKHQTKLTHRDLKKDSLYNTYTRRGLPPTPIGMPSKQAIRAALHPFKFGALYYILDEHHHDRHIFTATFAAHKQEKVKQKTVTQQTASNTQ